MYVCVCICVHVVTVLPGYVCHEQQELNPPSHLCARTGSGRVRVLLGTCRLDETQHGHDKEEPYVGQ